MKSKLLLTLVSAILFGTIAARAASAQDYIVKVGEIVKLEIPASGRSILNRSTYKSGKWDVNALDLELLSYSWDYAYVRGKRATPLSVVQLTVTHNHDGIFGDKYYAAFHVRVLSDEPTGIAISDSSIDLIVNEECTLSATISGGPGTCSRYSEDPNVASITATGNTACVRGKTPGITYIVVSTAGGKYTARCRISVMSPQPASVSVLPTSLTMTVDETASLQALVTPTNASTTLNWQSSNSTVASVTQSGKVTARSAGTTTITVSTSNSKTAACVVTVIASQQSDPEPEAEQDSCSWEGNYKVRSVVQKLGVTGYAYPTEYEMTIKKIDDDYYVTSIIGMNADFSIYHGLLLQPEDDGTATIVLDNNDMLFGRISSSQHMSELFLLSASPTYQWINRGTVKLARQSDGSITLSEFSVFAYGAETGYEPMLDANYSNSRAVSVTAPISVVSDDASAIAIQVYDLHGTCLYNGHAENLPLLPSGLYLIRQAGILRKVLLHN